MSDQKVKFISKEGLFEMMENKENFKLVEVLAEVDYETVHIPFAINIPVNKLAELAPAILPDKNQCVVVYCSDFLCTASTGAARFLQSMGYKYILDYKGGKQDWNNAGLPLIKS